METIDYQDDYLYLYIINQYIGRDTAPGNIPSRPVRWPWFLNIWVNRKTLAGSCACACGSVGTYSRMCGAMLQQAFFRTKICAIEILSLCLHKTLIQIKMGTKQTTKTGNVKMQNLRDSETKKEEKKPFKLTIVSKEELEKLRIPVYPYLIW